MSSREEMEIEFNRFVSGNNTFSRDNLEGHITGSCWIVNRERTKVLLTHHRKLDIWIPTGGHSEGEEDPFLIAKREGEEETGLKLTPYFYAPFSIDIHHIPKYRDTPSHKHYDYTYIFYPEDSHDFTVSSESFNLKWIPLEGIEEYTKEENVINMAKRTLEMEWNLETTTY